MGGGARNREISHNKISHKTAEVQDEVFSCFIWKQIVQTFFIDASFFLILNSKDIFLI